MPTRVVVVGDTHLPRFGRQLPAALVAGLRDADLILHCGDITAPFVLELLEQHAPTIAVAGNNDPPELAERLGQRRVVDVEALSIGLTHGHAGPGRTTRDRALRAFEGSDPLAAICYGHSHMPRVERLADGRWLLNPGSPTDKRREPSFSYLRLIVDGVTMEPELIRYATRA